MKIHAMGLALVVAAGAWGASMSTVACSSSSNSGSSSGGSSGGEDGSVADTGSSSGGGSGSSSGSSDSGSGSGSSSGSSSGSGSGSSSGGADAGMCMPADGNFTIVYTANANNPAGCPATPATQTVTWPPDSGTVPFANCTCADSTQTCVAMHENDAGTVITETITYTFTSSNFSGTVTFSDDAGMCDYTFTGTMI